MIISIYCTFGSCKELHWVPFEMDEGDPLLDRSDLFGGQPELLSIHGRNIPLLDGEIQYVKLSDIVSPEVPKETVSNEAGPKMIPEEKLLQSLSSHAELWWMFQSVDQAVEGIILQVDAKLGDGHGHRVVKVLLLLAPLLALFIYLGVSAVAGGSGGRRTAPRVSSAVKQI